MVLRKSLLVFILLILSVNARAGVFFEPYIGSSNGEGESSYSSGNYTHSYSGRIIGGRLGWALQNRWMFGVDYSINQVIMDSEQSSAYASDEISKKQIGLMVGKIFKGWKVWANYFISGEITGADAAANSNQFISENDEFSDLSGLSAGASLFITKNFQLNAEYRILSYGSVSNNGSLNSSYSSLDIAEYGIYISLPLGGGCK